MDISFIHDIENLLAGDLPGEDAQNKMSPVDSQHYRTIQEDHKTACVMVLLYPKNKEWHICLIERTDLNPDDKHGGQISLPGGQLSDLDVSLEDCALRETQEEIGVAPESIGVLGGLTPIYVFVSNYLVHPFVGFSTEYPHFLKQESEVTNIIEVPVKHFLKSKYKGAEDLEVRGLTLSKVPFYDVYGKKLWGATAMIMSEFEHVIAELDLP